MLGAAGHPLFGDDAITLLLATLSVTSKLQTKSFINKKATLSLALAARGAERATEPEQYYHIEYMSYINITIIYIYI